MTRKDDIIKVLEDQAKTKRENKLRAFNPYPKQAEFMALGVAKRYHSVSSPPMPCNR